MSKKGSKAVFIGISGVLAICAVIFIADASHGAAIPTFPFYASSLKATIIIIGVLAPCGSALPILLSRRGEGSARRDAF